MAENIHKSATRLHRAIENFLVYAQLELFASDRDKLQALRKIGAHDTDKLVELLALQTARRHERGADVTYSGAPASPIIANNQFSKMMEEILDNAFKFSQKGNPVSVTAQPEGEWVRRHRP